MIIQAARITPKQLC